MLILRGAEHRDVLLDALALLGAAAADDDESARLVADRLADPALTAIALAQGYVSLCTRYGIPAPGQGSERGDDWHRLNLFMGDPAKWEWSRIRDDES